MSTKRLVVVGLPIGFQRLRIAFALGDLGKRLVEPVEDAMVEPGARAGFQCSPAPSDALKAKKVLLQTSRS